MNMFKCTLQASINSTGDSLRSSATAAHIHSYIKNALSRLGIPHNIGITTLLFPINVCKFFKVPR